MSIKRLVKDVIRPVVGGMPDRIQKLRRIRHLEASRPAVSAAKLVDDLAGLPVRRGAVVLVHSSLKALGYVQGGADAVVAALVEVFVERNAGTVMLPTFSIDGSMYRTLTSGRVFDVNATPSNLGAIPEAFQRHSEARRSVHPTHSLAAIGRDAASLVDGHHRCGSSFGPGSPMAEFLAAGGYLLGLGTDLGHVTFYHCLEEIEDDFPIDVFTPDSPIEADCRGDDGQIHRLHVNAHDGAVASTRIDRPENMAIRQFFQDRFERHAGLSWHPVGEASAWQVEAPRLYDQIKRLMQEGITIYSRKSDLPDAAHGADASSFLKTEPRPK